jgi:hypothetical protein
MKKRILDLHALVEVCRFALNWVGSEYGRLRSPSRLCATLRPLARRYAALTAVVVGQDNPPIRAKAKRKIGLLGAETSEGTSYLCEIGGVIAWLHQTVMEFGAVLA